MDFWKMAGFGLVGMLSGVVVASVTSANETLDKNSSRHRDFQLLENYNTELVNIFLEVGLMRDRYAPSVYAMHHALIQLLTMSQFLDRLPPLMSWSQTASSYHYDVDTHADMLLMHVQEYVEKEGSLREHLNCIKKVAAEVSKAVAGRNDIIHSQRQDMSVPAYPLR
jgi:hypothetical protein